MASNKSAWPCGKALRKPFPVEAKVIGGPKYRREERHRSRDVAVREQIWKHPTFPAKLTSAVHMLEKGDPWLKIPALPCQLS